MLAVKKSIPVVVDDLACLKLGEALLLFLDGVNPESDLDSLPLGGGIENAPDRPGSESAATNEHRDVAVIEDEPKGEVLRVNLGNPQLGLVGVFDELQGNKLQESSDLIGYLTHRSSWDPLNRVRLGWCRAKPAGHEPACGPNVLCRV